MEVAVQDGGLLEIFVRDQTGDWGNPNNHVVFGDLLFLRSDDH